MRRIDVFNGDADGLCALRLLAEGRLVNLASWREGTELPAGRRGRFDLRQPCAMAP